MNFDDSNSFFNHSDFDFAESAREEESTQNMFKINTYRDTMTIESETNQNSLNLILFNNEAILGDKIHGAVKLVVENYLPQGRVELVLESTLKINKPAKHTKYNMDQYLNQYKSFIKNKKLEEKLKKKPKQHIGKRLLTPIHKIKKKMSFFSTDKHFVLGGIKRLENIDDPKYQVSKIIKQKFTNSVNKMKNILRWDFSKKSFKSGTFMEEEVHSPNSLKSDELSPNTKNQLQTIKQVASRNTKVQLFKQDPKKRKTAKFASVDKFTGDNKMSLLNSVTNNGDTKPETDNKDNQFNFKTFNKMPTEMPKLSKKESWRFGNSTQSQKPNSEYKAHSHRHPISDFLEYEEYHLKKSKVTLFEFKEEVKNHLSMIIPFQVELPEDTSPSFDQVVKKGMALDFETIYNLRQGILNTFENYEKQTSLMERTKVNVNLKEKMGTFVISPNLVEADKSLILEKSKMSSLTINDKSFVTALIQKKKTD